MDLIINNWLLQTLMCALGSSLTIEVNIFLFLQGVLSFLLILAAVLKFDLSGFSFRHFKKEQKAPLLQ